MEYDGSMVDDWFVWNDDEFVKSWDAFKSDWLIDALIEYDGIMIGDDWLLTSWVEFDMWMDCDGCMEDTFVISGWIDSIFVWDGIAVWEGWLAWKSDSRDGWDDWEVWVSIGLVNTDFRNDEMIMSDGWSVDNVWVACVACVSIVWLRNEEGWIDDKIEWDGWSVCNVWGLIEREAIEDDWIGGPVGKVV